MAKSTNYINLLSKLIKPSEDNNENENDQFSKYWSELKLKLADTID